MAEVLDLEIWPLGGIEDLPDDQLPLTLESMQTLRQSWREARASLASRAAIAEFNQQLEREWAIETGQIENLYDIERGVTQTLIEEGFRAALLERGSTNKPPEFVLGLIEDQRDALQGLFDFVKQDRPLGTSYIKELQAEMTRRQPTTEAFDLKGNRIEVPLRRGEWKIVPNYPLRDGKRFLYCPPEQTASEMDRLVEMHQKHQNLGIAPEARAAWLHHRFTQIHPFQDGNGRVARALASLVLIQGEMFPMIVPREDKDSYLDALEVADGGNLRPFVLLIARRQQAEYRKAQASIARAAPTSSSVQEAATALVHAVRLSSPLRWRLERISEVGGAIDLRLYTAVQEANIAMDAFSPLMAQGTGMSQPFVRQATDGETLSEEEVESIRSHFEESTVKPESPVRRSTIEFGPGPVAGLEGTLHILVFSPEENRLESVHAAGLLQTSHQTLHLLSDLLVVPSIEEAHRQLDLARDWASRVFASCLDELRRRIKTI